MDIEVSQYLYRLTFVLLVRKEGESGNAACYQNGCNAGPVLSFTRSLFGITAEPVRLS